MAAFTNINKEKKFIFLHPMRNGGKSIEQIVFNRSPGDGTSDHKSPKEWVDHLGSEKELNTYFKFGFSRNPWDRIVSLYFYRKNNLNNLNKYTFEQYVTNLNKNVKMVKTHMDKMNQVEWFYHNGKPIDFIGRFENYAEDFEKVKEILGLDASLVLPQLNASKKRQPYQEMYNDETRKLVGEMYKQDIEYFNYKFGE